MESVAAEPMTKAFTRAKSTFPFSFSGSGGGGSGSLLA
jgi:hypothetical protein